MESAGCRTGGLNRSWLTDRMLQNRLHYRLPASGIALLGSSVGPPVWRVMLDYAGWNSVPGRNMACMMMARLRGERDPR